MKSKPFVDGVRSSLEEGVGVAVFPEGTTTGGTSILPFKTGAFAAVESTDLVIQPACFVISSVSGRRGPVPAEVYSWDDDRTLAKYAWDILGLKRIYIQLIFGDPIPSGANRKSLAETSQMAVERLMHSASLHPENFRTTVS